MPANLKLALKLGFYSGVVSLFISITGMVETFNRLNIINGIVAIGHGLLIIIMFMTGYYYASKIGKTGKALQDIEIHAQNKMQALFGGFVTGSISGTFLAILVLLESQFNLRSVLINVSPDLISILSFGSDTLLSSLFLVLLGSIVGILGVLMYLLQVDIRRPLASGLIWLSFLGLISGTIRTTISEIGIPRAFAKIFVTIEGLTPIGAVIIFILAIAISIANHRWQEPLKEHIADLPPAKQRNLRYGTWALGIFIMLYLPWMVGRVTSDMLVLVGIYIIMGFGLNIVVGRAGLLDLGYVAFFAVGAYATAILTSADEIPQIQLSFWVALPIVVIITGIAGLMVGAPVLRMRGDYLAIVTLGFGEIARFLVQSDWLKPWLGGAQGVIKIPSVPVPTFISSDGVLRGPQEIYYLVLAFVLVALFISVRLEKSRVGRAWEAMREDEQVAEAMGINTVSYKLLAFGLGAMIASLGGAVFAAKLSTAFPSSFNVEVSITVLSLLIIGGLGSLPGVVVGAFALVGLPELLREFSEYRLMIYGAVLIAMMILRPDGLVPSKRKARELHEDEASQDAWLKSEATATTD